jgi:hypothetical protein
MSETVEQHFARFKSTIAEHLRSTGMHLSCSDLLEFSVEVARGGMPGVAHAVCAHYLDIESERKETSPDGFTVYEYEKDSSYVLVPTAFFTEGTDMVLEAFRRTFASPEHEQIYPCEITGANSDDKRHQLIDLLTLSYSGGMGGQSLYDDQEAVH